MNLYNQSTSDTFVSLKMKNAMFQPVVPDLLNYSIWLDSERAEKSCQVGITGIQSSSSRGGNNNRRVTGWQFVFLLRDMSPGHHHQQPKKSLRFGDVVQGIDVVKSLCCSRILSSHFSDGLRLTLEAIWKKKMIWTFLKNWIFFVFLIYLWFWIFNNFEIILYNLFHWFNYYNREN